MSVHTQKRAAGSGCCGVTCRDSQLLSFHGVNVLTMVDAEAPQSQVGSSRLAPVGRRESAPAHCCSFNSPSLT